MPRCRPATGSAFRPARKPPIGRAGGGAAGALILAVGLLGSQAAHAADRTDVFIGDSLSFGYGANLEIFDILLNGPVDASTRGYNDDAIALFESATGEVSHGVGLGVPAEETTTFVDGGALGAIVPGLVPEALNGAFQPGETQRQALARVLGEAAAAGRPVRTLTVQLGVNDLSAIGDELASLTPEQFEVRLAAEIDGVVTRLRPIVDDALRLAPEAQVVIVGYYDPYPGLPDPTSDPFSAVSTIGVRALNASLAELAGEYRAVFVDPFDRFVGREAELTYIDRGGLEASNVHPEPAGYAELAAAYAEAWGAFCLADLTGDGIADIFDVLGYFDAFSRGDRAADLSRGAGTGVLDVFDILRYLDVFAGGC